MNNVPISVQQAIEGLNDKRNSRNIRDNYMHTLESIRRASERAIEDYKREIFKSK